MGEDMLDTEQGWAALQAGLADGAILVTDSGKAPWGQVMLTREHVIVADEPAALGGQDSGPTPTDMVLMALGGCTAITLRMYAKRKDWTIDRIAVRLCYEHDEKAQADFKKIERIIDIAGPLDAEQHARLMAIAEKCPVHLMLTGNVAVRTEAASTAS